MTPTTNNDTAQVFIVDDDPQILTAFSRLLGAAGFSVKAFGSGHEFLSQHDDNVPGCALVDIRMGDINGLQVQEALASQGAERPIVFITGCDDVHIGVSAMKAGAVDYIMKPVQDTDLIAAVTTAIEADRGARATRRERRDLEERYHRLTAREREVMAHVTSGRLNKQIANDLGIVEKTTKVHRARVMAKMEVRSVAALVHIAERLGLVSGGDQGGSRRGHA